MPGEVSGVAGDDGGQNAAPEPVVAPVEAAAAPAEVPASETLGEKAASSEAPALEEAAAPASEAPPAAEAAKPEEKAGEQKAEGEGAAEPPAPMTYEAFKLPDGFEAPEERMTAFTGLLGEHRIPQEVGQKLIDMHGEILRDAVNKMVERQNETFERMQRNWIEEFHDQNNSDTIANDAKSAVMMMFPNKKERAEFWKVMAFTGAGNHPLNIAAWARVKKALSERAAPPPSIPKDPQISMDRAERRYANRPS